MAEKFALEVGKLTLSTRDILDDYRIAYRSRRVSLMGRQLALSGRAGFGVFGDGKEVPQVALAHFARPGDFRSGYYRDQTIMFAVGALSVDEFFAQLFADDNLMAEPSSGGRQMNAHFATRSLDLDGNWRALTAMFNTAADMSCTAAHMPRIVGLAQASKLYREVESLHNFPDFSQNGEEVVFGTIGNGSCAEGLFWETINAVGLLQVPVVLSVWDDGYGISVTNEHQVVKANVYEALQGFKRVPGQTNGIDLYQVPGWDYPALLETYAMAVQSARESHIPAVIHVTDLTQPQGHSSSGSHERYKSAERLAWEEAQDCVGRMRTWMIEQDIASVETLDQLEAEERELVDETQQRAWAAKNAPIRQEIATVDDLLAQLARHTAYGPAVEEARSIYTQAQFPHRHHIVTAVERVLLITRQENSPAREALVMWYTSFKEANRQRYSSHLYSESALAAHRVPQVDPVYSDDAPEKAGHEILNACFDQILAREPRFIAFGQDLGLLGDVNLCFAGMQEKYGDLRVADTGIRESTIIGQAIGLALRGLRPVAEVQYLDYLLYALQTMSDDVASLHYRTRGGQKVPLIIRTRGHRQVGIWHSGSPLAGIINLVRGMLVLVPRNMTQAAGFYNTLLQSDEPALLIEVLNGYRIKEKLPDNIGSFTVIPGVPEILRVGEDVTVVTYGACCRIALEAAEHLAEVGISSEIIDVQSLLPFDRPGLIGQSLQKTNRVLFLDEDVPGGASAYMMQQVIEVQQGFYWLDAPPRTLTSQAHRPAYGGDGNYFSKPNVEDVVRAVYGLMHETHPADYPLFDR